MSVSVYENIDVTNMSLEEATEAEINDYSDSNLANNPLTYQASSPDEVALVEWSEQMGLVLVDRTLTTLKIRTPMGNIISYTIP